MVETVDVRPAVERETERRKARKEGQACQFFAGGRQRENRHIQVRIAYWDVSKIKPKECGNILTGFKLFENRIFI